MRARRLAALGLLAPLLGAAEPVGQDEKILAAMRSELSRSTTELVLPGAPKPYYVGYWVVDSSERSVEATLGAVVSDETSRDRAVKVEVRVGTPESDNSNFAGNLAADGDFVREAELISPTPAPLDDDDLGVRRALWLATDGAYKGAVEVLERKRAAKRSEVASKTDVPSFSTEKPATTIEHDAPKLAAGGDPAALARKVSAVFRSFPEVQRSDVHVLETTTKKRFVSSEGSSAVETAVFAGVEVTCSGQAEDGMPLERTAFVAAKIGEPIPEAAALSEAKRIGKELVELVHAPLVEDYAGPVLFEGKAAAQLVYELLGEALSGTPAPEGNEELEGPLARKLGRRVLPKGFTVFDDPTLRTWQGAPLLGAYLVDDEGMPSTRAPLVDDGRLTGFLMSRTPREGVLHSNGHGRSGLVGWAHGRVGNLFVEAKGGLPRSELRRRLARAAKDEGESAALVITELEPRTTATSGDIVPGAQVAYRIGADGKETLVRGAQIADLSVRDLRDVLATGSERALYGFLAESQGGLDVGVSVVAPSLLLEDVEVRGQKSPNKRAPVVPKPPMDPAPAK
ncbi:MAG TPA: metallopeptidase TldD-related protein [Polyangiaceae bacterium]|nr:metallopeptidase TldD-related protein [Polyangiaceae bacterium]